MNELLSITPLLQAQPRTETRTTDDEMIDQLWAMPPWVVGMPEWVVAEEDDQIALPLWVVKNLPEDKPIVPIKAQCHCACPDGMNTDVVTVYVRPVRLHPAC